MRMPKEDVLTIGNIYENGDPTCKANQTATTNVACSEEEMEKELELYLIEKLQVGKLILQAYKEGYDNGYEEGRNDKYWE